MQLGREDGRVLSMKRCSINVDYFYVDYFFQNFQGWLRIGEDTDQITWLGDNTARDATVAKAY